MDVTLLQSKVFARFNNALTDLWFDILCETILIKKTTLSWAWFYFS